jgi:hypothetical protein
MSRDRLGPSSFMVELLTGDARQFKKLVVVIVIIPIPLGVPAVLIFIPPSMVGLPAGLARCVQFVAPMLSLFALRTVVLDGFVQLVISSGDAPLAIVGAQNWGSSTHQNAGQSCGE